ncbi:MAG: 2-oxoacid:acceptor oxidoreductase family protein [bacterium]|nr:2-oxoacid:acceptor oxidoreductase family protein [bacterium]
MNLQDISILLSGEAGTGIMVLGQMLARTAASCGLHVFGYPEYPSRIRGGENTFLIRIAKKEIYSQKREIDCLLALKKEYVSRHATKLSPDGIIIDKFSQNTMALGALCKWLELPFEVLEKTIFTQFNNKGETVVEENIRQARKGHEAFCHAEPLVPDPIRDLDSASDSYKQIPAQGRDDKLVKASSGEILRVISGNEAIGEGAIEAGLSFSAIYPMTPVNGLLSFLANEAEKHSFIFRQPEDEIAGINMAIGASYAGAKSLVATSGGGFSLMTEGFGLAAMTETPIVIVFGSRPGPSTGVATQTEQGDLQFALHAGQGDFPRIILAPGDIEECYFLTKEAFRIAEEYKTPVILLVDKYLCESIKTINYPPMSDKSTIKLRPLPETTVNSYEHDEKGVTSEDSANKMAMAKKRMAKLQEIKAIIPAAKLYGSQRAPTTFVGWGSVKGPILEAMEERNNNGITANFVHFNFINPLPKNTEEILKSCERLILVENNIIGQFGQWLRAQTGINIEEKILKFNGEPLYPEEITI